MTNIQDLAPEMSHWPNSVQGMKFKYKVHRATLLSHSSILRFSCCNIALFFFFNFLKKPKGHPAHSTASLSAVWHLGLQEGLRIALPQPDAYFWWLKAWWEPSGKPRTCPLGACRCYSGGGGGKVSCLLSPLPTGAPLPTALLTPAGLAWGEPKMLESAGGGFSRQLRNPWLEPVPRKPFPKQDSKLSLTISFQSLTLTHSPALAPRCRRHKECHCGPPVLFHCCTATETASLLPACVYSCCSMRPQCWAWHRPLSQLNPEMWKTYYAQRKMWLWGWCYHHLARIL